jgi:hypothetical protein
VKAEGFCGGERVEFRILELCSYGDRGDYQVLPMRAFAPELDTVLKELSRNQHRALLLEDALLANVNDVSITVYRDGRGILEGVRPDSPGAAWKVYRSVMEREV